MDKLREYVSQPIKELFGWLLLLTGATFLAMLFEHGNDFVWYQKLTVIIIISIFITMSADWLNKVRDSRDKGTKLYRDGYSAGLNDALDLMENKLNGR